MKRFVEREIHIVALRDIAPGEEITVNDNGRPDDGGPFWFEPEPKPEPEPKLEPA